MINLDLPILRDHNKNWWRYTVRCPLCGKTALSWQESMRLGWFLFDDEGEPHSCPKARLSRKDRLKLKETGGITE